MATKEYKEKHDKVGRVLHQELLRSTTGKVDTVPYYQYEPKSIVETERYKIYWDRTIRTDRETIANRPDVVVHDKKKRKNSSH